MESDQTKEAVENTEPKEMTEAEKAAREREMDIAEAGIRHATNLRFFLYFVIGIPLGYAVSYMFQSTQFHSVVSFERYFRYFYYVLYPQTTGSEFATSMLGNFHYVAWGGIFGVAMLLFLLGSIPVRNACNAAKAVMPDKMAKDIAKWYSGRGLVVFGKIPNRDTSVTASVKRTASSIWRIIKTVFIVLLIIIGLFVVMVKCGW